MDKKKEYLIKFLKIVISLSLIAYLLSKNDWQNIISKIKSINILYFIIPLLITCIIPPLIVTIRWKILIAPGNIKINFLELLKLSYTGLFFNVVLPGSVGGDTVKAVLFYNVTKNSSIAATSIVLDRVIGLIALALVSAISSAVYYKITSDFTFSIEAGGFLIILFIFLGLSLLAPVQNTILSVFRWLKLKKLEEFTEKSLEFVNWLKNYPSILTNTILISILGHITAIIVCYLTALSLDLKVSVGYYFLFYPLIALISSVPISIGGIGVRESAFAYFFSRVGVPESASISLSLLVFSQGLAVGLLGGLVYIISSFIEKKKKPESSNPG